LNRTRRRNSYFALGNVDTNDYGAYSPGINANLPINSVPAVSAARPGILTTAELNLVPNLS
jgi:hypothetical protein